MMAPEANWRSCFRNGLFDNKIALVSGGGTGIGKSIVIELGKPTN